MDSFLGTWKVQLEKSTGLVEIGKLLGWTEEKQQMFSSMGYTMVLEPAGDKFRCLLDYGSSKTEFLFKLGEPFDYSGADGSSAKCTATIEDGKMVEHYEQSPEAKWQTVREVDGESMKAITFIEGAPDEQCVQALVKV